MPPPIYELAGTHRPRVPILPQMITGVVGLPRISIDLETGAFVLLCCRRTTSNPIVPLTKLV